jgi:hypothetical protein
MGTMENGNDMTNGDNGSTAPQKKDAAAPQPARGARGRAGCLALEQDARLLLADLGKRLSVTEICRRRGWTRNAYYRRLRVAEKFAREEYDPRRAMAVFLKREARCQRLQAAADRCMKQVAFCLRGVSASDDRVKPAALAALIGAFVKALKFQADCERDLWQSARDMSLLPSQEPTGKEPVTLAELIKASIEEYGEEAHELPEDQSPQQDTPQGP